MKTLSRAPLIALAFMQLAITTGCSRGPEKKVEINEGSFVATEPSAVSGDMQDSKNCSLDTINDQLRTDGNWTTTHGSTLTFNGWAFLNDSTRAAPETYIQLFGPALTYYAKTTERYMRPDANKDHHLDAKLAVGFKLTAKTDAIEPGIYQINILQSFNNSVESCSTSATLTVN